MDNHERHIIVQEDKPKSKAVKLFWKIVFWIGAALILAKCMHGLLCLLILKYPELAQKFPWAVFWIKP